MTKTLKLKKWEPESIPDDKTLLVIGKRGSGKSTFIADILHAKKDKIGSAVVISGTEESNGFYSRFIPGVFIHHEYDSSILSNIFDRQRAMIKQNNVQPVLLILDDCMYDKSFFKDPLFRNLMLNGRHYKLFTIISTQYALDVPPFARSNFDYCIVYRDPIKSNRERLYKQFFGIFPSMAEFNDVYDACSENFECLVLDQTSRSNAISDCIFWYRAKLRSHFKFGSPSFWRAAQQMMQMSKKRKAPPEGASKKIQKSTIIKKLL